MSWTVNAVTGPEKSGNTLYCVNSRFGPWSEFYGSFPADRKSYTFEGSNQYGAWTCAYYFYNFLNDNGIPVAGYGDISSGGLVRTDLLYSDVGPRALPKESLTPLGSTLSPPLDAIVQETNLDSDNFFAESMFATLGLTLRGASDPSSAVEAEEELLDAMGLNTLNACVLSDGSGLSRKNYVSPEFFVKFLRKMFGSKVREAYLASLPSPGSRGTLKYRMQGAPDSVKSRIKMKSGSMNGVRCMSGYILPPPDGKDSDTIIFSILTNNVSGSSSTTATILDEIILSLAGE